MAAENRAIGQGQISALTGRQVGGHEEERLHRAVMVG